MKHYCIRGTSLLTIMDPHTFTADYQNLIPVVCFHKKKKHEQNTYHIQIKSTKMYIQLDNCFIYTYFDCSIKGWNLSYYHNYRLMGQLSLIKGYSYCQRGEGNLIILLGYKNIITIKLHFLIMSITQSYYLGILSGMLRMSCKKQLFNLRE